jgi:hypothetical protein
VEAFMKRSEVIKELLSSYYFQHGKRSDNNLLRKANKMIEQFEKIEKQCCDKL